MIDRTEVARKLATTESLSKLVIAAAFEVSNTLGTGFLEVVYARALALEMEFRGVPFEREAPLPVSYKGTRIGTYRPDFVVDRRLIVEIKAVEGLGPPHLGQVLNYLRASELEVGLLMNFGTPRVQVRRVLK